MPQPADVAHLLRRAGFGGTLAQINTLAAQPWATTVDQLLDFSHAPADVEPGLLQGDTTSVDFLNMEIPLLHWWFDRMITTTTPLQEKMTLFWHGHFTTSNEHQNDSTLMYRQNALFRKNVLGNFRDLAQKVAIHPAMLFYLNNDVNVKGTPNENFARELMELFILGVGNYTQQDVSEAARAWTGYNTLDGDHRTFHFYPDRHDTGMKTIFGVTQNWDGPGVIDYILNGNAAKKKIAADYIAGKLWSFFAYTNPDPVLASALGDVFLGADLDLKVLLRTIFLRPEFLSAQARFALVRGPAEWMVACLRANNSVSAGTQPEWYMGDMGQLLFRPPNVAGWKQNAYWLGASLLWQRATWAKWCAIQTTGTLGDTEAMTVPAAVQRAFDVYSIDSPTAGTRSRIETWLTAQRADTTLTPQYRLYNFNIIMMLTPEFTLA